MEPTRRINPSLLKKSAARTAAVQCLYKAEVMGETLKPDAFIRDYKAHIADDAEEAQSISGGMEPDFAFMGKLLTGYAEFASELEPFVNQVLRDNWKKDRVSPLILAILRMGVYELRFNEKLGVGAIINEYANITASFLSEKDVDFIHAALNALAPEFRANGSPKHG